MVGMIGHPLAEGQDRLLLDGEEKIKCDMDVFIIRSTC